MLQPLNITKVKLYKDFKKSETSFQTIGKMRKTSDDSGIIGQQILGIGLNQSNIELVYVNITAEPTLIIDNGDLDKNVYQYTVITRGLETDDKSVPPTLYNADMQTDHYLGEQVGIVVSSHYIEQAITAFTTTTTTETVTAGEAIDSTSGNLFVSLHTDGKYYKYHKTNYPNLQGVILAGQTISVDGTFILYNLKAITTGWTGLTNGEFVFADNGGTATHTESGTTTYAGIARGSTSIVGAERSPSFSGAISDSSFRITDNADSTKQVAFEAGVITTGTTRTITVPDMSGTLATTDNAQTFSGVQTFADDSARSATNAAPVDEKSFTNKKYVDDNITGLPIAAGSCIYATGSKTGSGTITNLTASIDLLGEVSSSAITIQQSGVYLVSFNVDFPSLNATVITFSGSLNRNGSETLLYSQLSGGTQDAVKTTSSSTKIVALSASDSITASVSSSSGSFSFSVGIVIKRLY